MSVDFSSSFFSCFGDINHNGNIQLELAVRDINVSFGSAVTS